jgi:hypothetical protein
VARLIATLAVGRDIRAVKAQLKKGAAELSVLDLTVTGEADDAGLSRRGASARQGDGRR